MELVPRRDSIRNEANAWLARFAPLVMDAPVAPTAQELEARLQTLAELRESGAEVQRSLRDLIGPEGLELGTTIDQALKSTDGIERELRSRLAAIDPGNPAGLVNLPALREELDERLAREEVGLPAAGEVPAVLEMETAPGNVAGAMGIGCFAFAWLSFTTFHMVLMVGGMFSSMGWIALAMLGFYSIFYFVGFAMAFGAFVAAANERIVLNGRDLTILRKGFGITHKVTKRLARNAKASVGPNKTAWKSENAPTPIGLMLPAENGKQIALAASALPDQRDAAAERLNAYLAIYGR